MQNINEIISLRNTNRPKLIGYSVKCENCEKQNSRGKIIMNCKGCGSFMCNLCRGNADTICVNCHELLAKKNIGSSIRCQSCNEKHIKNTMRVCKKCGKLIVFCPTNYLSNGIPYFFDKYLGYRCKVC